MSTFSEHSNQGQDKERPFAGLGSAVFLCSHVQREIEIETETKKGLEGRKTYSVR